MILLADRVLDGRSDQPLVGGMDVVVRRNAFGRQVDSFEGVVEINGLGAGLDPGPMPAVFIRAPVVESIGADVEVLGRVCLNREKPDPYGDGERVGRIVAIRQGNLLATAFHPELTGDLRVHRLFVGMINQARQGAGWNGAGSDEEQR
jgi:5'-phosphate synthase pdxT subunit